MSVDFNASFSGSAETFGAKMTETPAPMTASMKETGGGSASNYEALRNKPKINGHELIGDMTPAQLGITDGRRATCYPGMEDGMTGATPVKANAVTDGKIITGCGVGGALDFACELITALCGKAKADEIAESVVHHVYG